MSPTLSIIIPAYNEERFIGTLLRQIKAVDLAPLGVEKEIIVVDDCSRDRTPAIVAAEPGVMLHRMPTNGGKGRAVRAGIGQATGDYLIVQDADLEYDPNDYPALLAPILEGKADAVFGSRFVSGGGTIDYPLPKYLLNRIFNIGLQALFGFALNDTSNAFKAYRTRTLEGLRPFLAPHFNLTIELPLKTIVRGYSWTVIPITWRNRRVGAAKFRIKEMGARYFFIVMYVWLEKYFSRGDYRKR